MVDNLTKEQRSKVMSSIKGKNTEPEMIVRRLLWRQKFRYRIHDEFTKWLKKKEIKWRINVKSKNYGW